MDTKPTITSQPLEVDSMSAAAPAPSRSLGDRIRNDFFTQDTWIGDADYGTLCMPRLNPWSRKTRDPKTARDLPFYGLTDKLPIFLGVICGLQHALAALAGLITPPLILTSSFALDSSQGSYLISASLISAGILSALQMSRFIIPGTKYQIGTGILSVVGTSFATLSAASAIANALYANGTCPMITTADGTLAKGPCPEGYGYVLGTSAICSLLEVGIAFLPVRIIKRLFPRIITGPVVILIGLSLVGESGFINWGGGSACHDRPATGFFSLCPNIAGPNPLPWGSAEYLGLGLLSFMTIVLVELFGSAAMRSGSIVIGLILPTLVAGIPGGYTSRATIDAAPAITFLWVETFPLKIYGPAVLPLLAVYCALSAEAVGDISSASEASRLETTGPVFDRRVQGGVLSDGLAGTLSALFTITPMSLYAQNTAIIGLTRVASRRAGFWCCGWLIFFGVIGKIGGLIQAIPNPILGGVTTFLFASVAVAGLSILSHVNLRSRRNRFILATSFVFGFGNLLLPDWSSYFLPETDNKSLDGFYTAVEIIISTPFLICAIAGLIANAILPYDHEDLEIERNPHADVETARLDRDAPAATTSASGSEIEAAVDEKRSA